MATISPKNIAILKDLLKDSFLDQSDLKKNLKPEIFLFLKKAYNSKISDTFSWGIFSLLLNLVDTNQSLPLAQDKINLATYIDLFIIATDMLDDFMDQDNIEFNVLPDQKDSIKQLIHYSLTNIFSVINKESKTTFLKNLAFSLDAQGKDMNDYLYFGSSEWDYFLRSVDRSVYLLNAIVQISLQHPQRSLFTFSYFFSTSSQIKNDILNLLSDNPSDLYQKKATLPILIAFTQMDKDAPIASLFHDYIVHHDLEKSETIKNYILDCGAIEYSNYIALQCKNTAFNYLRAQYPTSKNEICKLYEYLNN